MADIWSSILNFLEPYSDIIQIIPIIIVASIIFGILTRIIKKIY